MTKVAIVTGCSKGIGLACCQLLLQEGYEVIGMARSKPSELKDEKHFHFSAIDLSDFAAVNTFWESNTTLNNLFASANECLLINNAAQLGPIEASEQLQLGDICQTYHTNVIALHLCCNQFIKLTSQKAIPKTVLNISSGAGRKPYAAWSVYCATKAAVDMLSQCINEEQKMVPAPTRLWSVAPGVIETDMQRHIRAAKTPAFTSQQRFIGLKNKNELQTPQATAQQLYQFYRNRNNYLDQTLVDLRLIEPIGQ